MVEEIWENIDGFNGKYQVSNFGKVKSLDRIEETRGSTRTRNGRVLKLAISKNGYSRVCIVDYSNQKFACVHRLVAQAFIPNPDNKPQVNHINGIKTDNRVENLEWNTRSENQRHSIRTGLKVTPRGDKSILSKLKESEVVEIRRLLKETNLMQREIAAKFNIHRSNVSAIKHNKCWTHI